MATGRLILLLLALPFLFVLVPVQNQSVPLIVSDTKSLRSTPLEERAFGGDIDCRVDRFKGINFRCSVVNKSNVTLSSTDGFFLYYQLKSASEGVIESGKLHIDKIAPSGSAKIRGRVPLPKESGSYLLTFDVHQDWVRTFEINSSYKFTVADLSEQPRDNQVYADLNRYASKVVYRSPVGRKVSDPGWLVAYQDGDDTRLLPYDDHTDVYHKLLEEAQAAQQLGYWSRAITADLDGSGHEDVILGTYGVFSGINSRLRVFNLKANATRENESIRDMNIVGFIEQILAADFNNDGLLDISATSYQKFYLLENAGNGAFVDKSADSGFRRDEFTYPKPEGGEAVDLDFDGKVDIVSGTRVFLNKGEFRFLEASESLGLPILFDEGVKVLDIDNDGDFDLVIVCLTGKECPGYHVYINENGTYKFRAFEALARFDGCQSLVVNSIDLNADGYEDLFFGTTGQGRCRTNMFFLNKSGKDFVHIPDALGKEALLVNVVKADFNGDMVVDLAARDIFNSLWVYESQPQSRPGGAKFSIIVLDDQGRRTKQGASIRITTPSGETFARHVESGYYVGMNGYPIVINYPESGEYTITSYLSGERQDRLSQPGVYLLDRNGLKRVATAPTH